jgi:hypothetical protein
MHSNRLRLGTRPDIRYLFLEWVTPHIVLIMYLRLYLALLSLNCHVLIASLRLPSQSPMRIFLGLTLFPMQPELHVSVGVFCVGMQSVNPWPTLLDAALCFQDDTHDTCLIHNDLLFSVYIDCVVERMSLFVDAIACKLLRALTAWGCTCVTQCVSSAYRAVHFVSADILNNRELPESPTDSESVCCSCVDCQLQPFVRMDEDCFTVHTDAPVPYDWTRKE